MLEKFLNALKNDENGGKDFYASAKAEAGSEISYILFKFLCVAEKEVKFVDINPCIITVTTVDESEKEKKEWMKSREAENPSRPYRPGRIYPFVRIESDLSDAKGR